MNPLPPILAWRLARQNQLTIARVQELWQQWLVAFKPVQEVTERAWGIVADVQDALQGYQAWQAGLLQAEQPVAQDFTAAYFNATTAQLAQRAWAGTGGGA